MKFGMQLDTSHAPLMKYDVYFQTNGVRMCLAELLAYKTVNPVLITEILHG